MVTIKYLIVSWHQNNQEINDVFIVITPEKVNQVICSLSKISILRLKPGLEYFSRYPDDKNSILLYYKGHNSRKNIGSFFSKVNYIICLFLPISTPSFKAIPQIGFEISC